ncbi:MAG: stage V sporulation protein AD [Oscillospiraceae bacterium]|nr:stage V sporulation protein AD [Oscillospiraceae bacterium]
MQRLGKNTIKFNHPPSVIGFASIASKKESEGPMAQYIDILSKDPMFGQQTWEKAESQMQRDVALKALEKAKLSPGNIDCLFAGDLLNQCIGSHYGLLELGIPFMGLYSACATMAESLISAAVFVESKAADHAMAVTSSHFCSAEKQYRFPLEYGGQRTPTSQWTVTGAGAAILGHGDVPPFVKAMTIGTIKDKGIKDVNNMGAAMAPAAALTIGQYFEDTVTNEDNFDLIVTGDLAHVGSQLLYELMEQDRYDLRGKHADCGMLIYDRETQDVCAGGSGCGCAATVLCSYILNSMKSGKLNEVLFVATGALMSPTSLQQKQNIPGIAHLIHLSTRKE